MSLFYIIRATDGCIRILIDISSFVVAPTLLSHSNIYIACAIAIVTAPTWHRSGFGNAAPGIRVPYFIRALVLYYFMYQTMSGHVVLRTIRTFCHTGLHIYTMLNAYRNGTTADGLCTNVLAERHVVGNDAPSFVYDRKWILTLCIFLLFVISNSVHVWYLYIQFFVCQCVCVQCMCIFDVFIYVHA